MAIDWNEIVKVAEGSLVQALTARVVAGLIAAAPALYYLSGPLGWIVSIAVALCVKYGDWLVYMVGDEWKNTAEGKAFEDAAIANANLPPTATPEEKERAKKAQEDAFDRLLGAG